MLLSCLPLFMLRNVLEEPNGPVVVGVSFFPFSTPMLMVARLSIPPGVPWWQPVVGVLVVLATTVACVYAAGRIFRVGLLMQGKEARVRDLVAGWSAANSPVAFAKKAVGQHWKSLKNVEEPEHGNQGNQATTTVELNCVGPGSDFAQRNRPSQKLKICVRSPAALTIGKPKSRAMGTGPSIGSTKRTPKPAETR